MVNLKLKDLLTEVVDTVTRRDGKLRLYRGIYDTKNDTGLGSNSIGISNKLVAALGPNFTDNEKAAAKFGSSVIEKVFPRNARILKLKDYNDIIRLFQQYTTQMTPGLAGKIKNSEGREQLQLIQQAGREVNKILSQEYDLIQAPFAPADGNFLAGKGIDAKLYVVLGN